MDEILKSKIQSLDEFVLILTQVREKLQQTSLLKSKIFGWMENFLSGK